MGFILDFDWNFMAVLKSEVKQVEEHTDIFPPLKLCHMTPSWPCWLLTLYLIPLQSISNFSLSSVSIQTYCPIFKNGSSKIIFKDTKVFNTYISNLITAFFSWRAPGLLLWHVTWLLCSKTMRKTTINLLNSLFAWHFFLISRGVSLQLTWNEQPGFIPYYVIVRLRRN